MMNSTIANSNSSSPISLECRCSAQYRETPRGGKTPIPSSTPASAGDCLCIRSEPLPYLFASQQTQQRRSRPPPRDGGGAGTCPSLPFGGSSFSPSPAHLLSPPPLSSRSVSSAVPGQIGGRPGDHVHLHPELGFPVQVRSCRNRPPLPLNNWCT